MKRSISLIFFVSFFLLTGSIAVAQITKGGKEMGTKDVREPALAGLWYPGDPEVLSRDVKRYLENAKKEAVEGQIVALISPHAGYMYSGQVAAYAYKLVEGMAFDSVIVVGPSHRYAFKGASLWPQGGFRTPLGVVPVDVELSKKLMERRKEIRFIPEAHAQENSLELQIPFLQSVLKSFKLVPIAMEPDWSWETCQYLASAIAEAAKGKKVLLVASSDLSHYYTYKIAVELDRIFINDIERFDAEGLNRDLKSGRAEACGGGPVITIMLAAKALGANKGQALKYLNSGDVTGDRSRVVGYAAGVFYKTAGGREKMKEEKKVGVDLGLNEEEKKTLHHIARTVIENKVKGKPVPDFKIESAILKENRGAFVTLQKRGQLRGCIGYIEGHGPLHNTIKEMAEAAAFRDPRFSPVKEKELPELDIEISVLTPLQRIKDIDEIQVGTHGIYIKKGWSSGLLLPQVATEYGWDRQTFLDHTCQKAGLPSSAWKEKDTEIYIFSADIF
ncbi:MAG TPA: AmmeMemoRadiSam system protein B [Thermodesulfobacteriota bacterium]|nr:AmmeMemoRadiSam system protein B [Thermodesulfobacteriota bacterium]